MPRPPLATPATNTTSDWRRLFMLIHPLVGDWRSPRQWAHGIRGIGHEGDNSEPKEVKRRIGMPEPGLQAGFGREWSADSPFNRDGSGVSGHSEASSSCKISTEVKIEIGFGRQMWFL
ncbi:hypothetical protein N7457_004865 [Penicillium paradoxum]|uniref:uncharacterized protein n=1 Tax=Penicillium paradoxum TaxID=176176 RepID=UPI0025477421|nr:uncharacterized protein N7457_004865 [Penicillium paradoxum]KAJ5783091.1 hypothetical protein N7457_004865 [Penicillium paradoxum]